MHISDFESDIRDYLICSGLNPDDFDIEGAAIRLFSRYSVDRICEIPYDEFIENVEDFKKPTHREETEEERTASDISMTLRKFADAIDGYAKAKVHSFTPYSMSLLDMDSDIACFQYLDENGFVKGGFTTDWWRNIADRIDRETIELPKDADGVPINIGDTVYDRDGHEYSVDHIVMYGSSRSKVFARGNGIDSSFDPSWFIHDRNRRWRIHQSAFESKEEEFKQRIYKLEEKEEELRQRIKEELRQRISMLEEKDGAENA